MFNSNYLLTETLPQSSLIQTMFSAERALLQVTTEWLWHIDIKHLNAMIFLDLKKTFNTINYAILLEKLKLYGVDCLPLKWFWSCSSDRKQQNFIDRAQSGFCDVTCDTFLC